MSSPQQGPEQEPVANVKSDRTEAELVAAGGGIAIQCQFCIGRSFRRSRLRSSDLPQIFLMRYPVRCRRCSQRQMVSFTVAGISVPSHVRHKQRRASAEHMGMDRPARPES